MPITLFPSLNTHGAFILNALPDFQISVRNHEDSVVGSVAIRKGHILQLIILGTVSMLVLLTGLWRFGVQALAGSHRVV
ncbi:MAG: hypothetical protein DWQ04_23535 [Chloroflexi bacterium]|nr:MAG: hypothetical protein DWQ04_23535 [Chloroflexota bacterium]